MKDFTVTLIANMRLDETGELNARCSMASADMSPYVMQALVACLIAKAVNYLEHRAADGCDVSDEMRCCRAAMQAVTGDYMDAELTGVRRMPLPPTN